MLDVLNFYTGQLQSPYGNNTLNNAPDRNVTSARRFEGMGLAGQGQAPLREAPSPAPPPNGQRLPESTRDDVSQQMKQHSDYLREVRVLWLPNGRLLLLPVLCPLNPPSLQSPRSLLKRPRLHHLLLALNRLRPTRLLRQHQSQLLLDRWSVASAR